MFYCFIKKKNLKNYDVLNFEYKSMMFIIDLKNYMLISNGFYNHVYLEDVCCI